MKHIRETVENRFRVSRLWHKDTLIESIRQAAVYPSLKGLSEESIMGVIHANPAVYIFRDYICS